MEGVGLWLIEAESVVGSHIELLSPAASAHTVHLVAADGSGVALHILILFPSIVLAIAPQAIALSGKPYIALLVFIDVDGTSLDRTYWSECLRILIPQVYLLQGRSPQAVLAVTEETIATAPFRLAVSGIAL